MTESFKIDLKDRSSVDALRALTWLLSDAREAAIGELKAREIIAVNASSVHFEGHIEEPLKLTEMTDPRKAAHVRIELLNDAIMTILSFRALRKHLGRLQIYPNDFQSKEYKPLDVDELLQEYDKNGKIGEKNLKTSGKMEKKIREVIETSVTPRLSGIYSQASLNTVLLQANAAKLDEILNSLNQSKGASTGAQAQERKKGRSGGQAQVKP